MGASGPTPVEKLGVDLKSKPWHDNPNLWLEEWKVDWNGMKSWLADQHQNQNWKIKLYFFKIHSFCASASAFFCMAFWMSHKNSTVPLWVFPGMAGPYVQALGEDTCFLDVQGQRTTTFNWRIAAMVAVATTVGCLLLGQIAPSSVCSGLFLYKFQIV